MSKPESTDQLSVFDYHLPDELIAREPLERRDASRLLVVDRERQHIESRLIQDLPDLVDPGDCLVVNDTRVLPAKLAGHRVATGGAWEGLFLGSEEDGRWRIIGQTRGRLQPGETISLVPVHPPAFPVPDQELRLLEQIAGGIWRAAPFPPGQPMELLERFGTMPLPPYIQRHIATDLDRQRYQTVFARHPGAVAAPTAGLHLSEDLIDRCRQNGLGFEHLTLHVGLGTFRPISSETLDDHVMHSEWCRISHATCQALNKVKQSRRRVVAVGTTVVRTLESASAGGTLEKFDDTTDLFIRPGHQFRSIDALLTNFHLPRSTLFVLVCAFCGTDLAQEAYRMAIANRYRFYSYGDAMLIL